MHRICEVSHIGPIMITCVGSMCDPELLVVTADMTSLLLKTRRTMSLFWMSPVQGELICAHGC